MPDPPPRYQPPRVIPMGNLHDLVAGGAGWCAPPPLAAPPLPAPPLRRRRGLWGFFGFWGRWLLRPSSRGVVLVDEGRGVPAVQLRDGRVLTARDLDAEAGAEDVFVFRR